MTGIRLVTAQSYRTRFLDPFTGAKAAAIAINTTLDQLPTYESVDSAAHATTGASLYTLDHMQLVRGRSRVRCGPWLCCTRHSFCLLVCRSLATRTFSTVGISS